MNRKNYEGEISSENLENGVDLVLDFEKIKKIAQSEDPVLPVAVQDIDSKEVIIVAYANELAVRNTLEKRIATFWSTSRGVLWEKGLTSGDQLEVVEVCVNCEQNSLLYKVKMVGKGSCHTKKEDGQTRYGCYYRRINGEKLEFIKKEPYI